MASPILATKLYIAPPRPETVLRPRLAERLNAGLRGKLTLISAPAGFGKTTLAGEWVAGCDYPVAWLSLDEEDSAPDRFLAYFVAALQTVAAGVGAGVLGALRSPQPPPLEAILAALLNEITAIPEHVVLVLDDYHTIDSRPVDQFLAFLLEHLPPQMHLVIATREDPQLPLARLRAGGQLAELRAADLRFTLDEAAGFLNRVMGLNLSGADIAALETRTEGWIAGLQLAAISMQGREDASGFIQSFTGSHHFVLDYLLEEVLQQQPEHIQAFLLRTAILGRMCGPLCEAVLGDAAAAGQATLEHLQRANLFIVPLDSERRWYRYHRLFADLLHQRLHQSMASAAGDGEAGVAGLHIRASIWYEANGLDVEAFHHATAANDVARAARLIEGNGMPLHFRGAVAPVLNWLEAQPVVVLDSIPMLWTAYASVLLVTGQAPRVEPVLQAAEKALQSAPQNDQTRDLIGRVAAIRATVAAAQFQVDAIISQSNHALAYLHPDNLAFRTSTAWKLGFAYHLQGNRTEARKAYAEVISVGTASGNIIFSGMAMIGLGNLQELDNQLHLAVETYQRSLQLLSDQLLPVTSTAQLGLARVFYEWNDLEAAEHYRQQSVQLVRQLEIIDRVVEGEIFLARLKLAQGDAAGAAAILAKAAQAVRQHNFVTLLPELVNMQVLVLLAQGDLEAAAELAQAHDFPLNRARVHLAGGDVPAGLAVLAQFRQQMAAKGWADEQLKAIVLQAVGYHLHGERSQAVQVLGDALVLAEPEGFVRLFVDEGLPMAQLVSEVAARGVMPGYTGKLLAAFEAEGRGYAGVASQPLVEPLTQREMEVLQLVAEGLSNREVAERLFLALDTVKGHNRRIFGKLQVQRRTEAVARARELGLL